MFRLQHAHVYLRLRPDYPPLTSKRSWTRPSAIDDLIRAPWLTLRTQSSRQACDSSNLSRLSLVLLFYSIASGKDVRGVTTATNVIRLLHLMCWEVEAEVLLLKMRNKKKLNCWWKGLKTKLLFLKFTSILVKKELVVHKMNHVLNEVWNSRLHSVELRCELFNEDEEVRVKTDFISDLISLLSSIYSSREEPFMSKSFSEKINKSIYMRCRWSGCRRRRGGVGHSSCQLRYVFTTITFIIWNFFSAFVQQDQQKQSCQLPQTHSGCFTDGWMEERLRAGAFKPKKAFVLTLSHESRK